MLQETWNKSDNKGGISDEISPISYFTHHAKKNLIFQKNCQKCNLFFLLLP